MKRLFLASAAAAALCLAPHALAQTGDPSEVPAPPPIAAEQTPDIEMNNDDVETPGFSTQAETAPPDQTSSASADARMSRNAITAEAAEAPLSAPGAAAPANASAVCAGRTLALDFGARSASLSRESRNTIEYGVDAASVCRLDQVTIADAADGRVAERRAEAVRAALMARGVPEERISVAEGATASSDVEARMTFAGVAGAQAQSASSAAAPSS